MLQLSLRLLGPPQVWVGSQPVIFPTRKALALLSYLALAAGEQSREQLAALLWPEASSARSHASLRNTLSQLHVAFRRTSAQAQRAGAALPPFLVVTHQTLALNPAALQLDLQVVEQAYVQARADRASRTHPAGGADAPLLQAAAQCQRGDFLAGFSLGDAPSFDDWVGLQREAWRRRLSLILDRLSEIQFASGEFAATAETAAAWIALDTLNEGAYQRKMRAHFAAGERGQALETYATCRALLATELHTEPSPTTTALATRIQAQPAQPPSASLPVDLTPVAFLESLFAGRSAEQAALAECLTQTAAGQPQLAVVQGEAGIGKTRLATEFLAWAATHATPRVATVLTGAAYESGSHLPFQPMVEALRGWFARATPEPAWAAWLTPLAELLPELRARYPSAASATLPALEHPQLFEAVAQLTLALSQRGPVVVFMDDLHWADSATLALLQYLLRRWHETHAPIMLLVGLRAETLRPLGQADGLASWLAQATRIAPPRQLMLEPLSEAATLEMLQMCLAPPQPDFAQWLFRETRGQPFYLLETLKDLLERGVLHPHRQAVGPWAFAVEAEHGLGQAARVPSSVRAVILARLQRLSPSAFALLAAAATLEQQLTFERLCAIANLAEDVALPALDELVSSRLLLEVHPLPARASTYVFPNDMLRDVVYTEAGDARRRLFHRRALAVLAAAQSPAAVLAHHALVAGQAEAAFQHSLAAGEAALRLAAPHEAQVHFERARQLAREAVVAGAEMEAQLRALYTQLGQAYELSGQPEQAAEVYAERARLGAH